ncbi:hypothetical protein K1X76_10170 [bacterium]|nr:hypothetical protein [bacterium]
MVDALQANQSTAYNDGVDQHSPDAIAKQNSPDGIAAQEQAKLSGNQQRGSAEAPSEDEKNLYEKLGQKTGASVVDGNMSKGKIGPLLDLKGMHERVKAQETARADFRKQHDFSQVDPETGELVHTEMLAMGAEEEAGLMDSEARFMDTGNNLGKNDEGLGNTDEALFQNSQADPMQGNSALMADAGTPISSAGRMTVEGSMSNNNLQPSGGGMAPPSKSTGMA